MLRSTGTRSKKGLPHVTMLRDGNIFGMGQSKPEPPKLTPILSRTQPNLAQVTEL